MMIVKMTRCRKTKYLPHDADTGQALTKSASCNAKWQNAKDPHRESGISQQHKIPEET